MRLPFVSRTLPSTLISICGLILITSTGPQTFADVLPSGRCQADIALQPSVNCSSDLMDALADQLNTWVTQNGRAPSLSSPELNERMQARIWSISRSFPKIAEALSHRALAILSFQPKSVASTYDTVSLLEKFDGENLGKDIWSDRAQKIIHFETRYLTTSAERAPFELSIRDGLLTDATGKLFDSTDADLRGLSNSKGKAMVVMNATGQIFASKDQQLGVLHHSTLLGGEPVAFAGEMVVKNGLITEIKNLSGHYLPSNEFFAQFLDRLILGKVPVEAINLLPVTVSAPQIADITWPLLSGNGSASENLSTAFHRAKRFMDLSSSSQLLQSLLSEATPPSLGAVFRNVDAIDHVGFIVPAGTSIETLEEAAKENGFTAGQRSFDSMIVAKELGQKLGQESVPTKIFICYEKLASGETRAIEVFAPSGPSAQPDKVLSWIKEGTGTHVAFRAKSDEAIEELRVRLSDDGYLMPDFMNQRAMANPAQGSLTIYFDLDKGKQKLRMEFVHTHDKTHDK